MQIVHATCVAISAQGLLLIGPSGAGKSQLAHRLIGRGAWLIADDQTILTANRANLLTASCPPGIRGRLEIRGLGIVSVPTQSAAPIQLVLDLDPTMRPPEGDYRMPEFHAWTPPMTGPNMAKTWPSVACVYFNPYRPDAVEMAFAALAKAREWGDSPAP